MEASHSSIPGECSGIQQIAGQKRQYPSLHPSLETRHLRPFGLSLTTTGPCLNSTDHITSPNTKRMKTEEPISSGLSLVDFSSKTTLDLGPSAGAVVSQSQTILQMNKIATPRPAPFQLPPTSVFSSGMPSFTFGNFAAMTKPPFIQARKTARYDQFLKYIDRKDGMSTDSQAQITLEKQAEMYTNTPIFTSAVSRHVEANLPRGWSTNEPVPQYGLIGLQEELHNNGQPDDEAPQTPEEGRLVFANINMPWSAFICGSQGAGKSHTLSCLLESALLKGNDAGELPKPLAGMVFHYDNYTNAYSTQLCEAAYLCSSGIPVTILVSPSNIWAMKKLYSNLPGLAQNSPQPRILPLYLEESSMDIEKILKLMAIDPTAERPPLYMEIVMNILREMAMEGSANAGFSYSEFRRRINNIQWVQGQLVPLNLRLQLLESFLKPSVTTKSTRPAPAAEDIWAFEAGTLTIIDLSDPFVNSNDACSLFTICLSNFLEGRNKCGRIIALDEAHKFLVQSGEARALTADLTSIIRQQRHTGTRVVIATQEPTLSPDLIDLCNATFVHRFLSPAWYEVLKAHLAGANKHESLGTTSLFDTIVALHTGEALLFCPTALMTLDMNKTGSSTVKAMGNGYAKIKIRNRLTTDGGKSITALDANNIIPTMAASNVPMYVVEKPPPSTTQQCQSKFQGQSNHYTFAKSITLPPRSPHNPIVADEVASSQHEPHNIDMRSRGGTLYDHIEQELRRQVQLNYNAGDKSFKQLNKFQKDVLYENVEYELLLGRGQIYSSVEKSVLGSMHREMIAACRAKQGLKKE